VAAPLLEFGGQLLYSLDCPACQSRVSLVLVDKASMACQRRNA
jgi:hypothetical protein